MKSVAIWASSCWLVLGACAGEAAPPAPDKPPAAQVSNGVPEGALATVTLDEQAERRLGIEVAPVARRSVPRVRTRGARAVVPPGSALTVQAPLTGTLELAPGASDAPRAGQRTRAGAPVFVLRPLFSPEARAALAGQAAAARGDEGQARAELAAAREAAVRAEALLAERAGSQRAVDEALAARAGAEARLAAAQMRQEALAGSTGGELEAIALPAPLDGVLRAVHAGPGQLVAAGAPLFEVLDTSRIWVRVPVYVGEADQVRADLPARVPQITGDLALLPVAAPPSADPAGATLDLYYAVDNSEGRLRPDQSLLVELTLETPAEEDTLPSSALVRDAAGGTWVYARTAPGRYERRRVLVERVVDGLAVLARGPPAGTEVVVTGAAELFGTEFFVNK